MKRIKLQQRILGIMTSNMLMVGYGHQIWEIKSIQIVKFIQDNYRRRKYKKGGKCAL